MIGTMGIGVDAQDNVIQYVPPNAPIVDQGNTISYGTYQPVAAGEQWSAEGVVQLAGGSGLSQATGQVIYRVVTITGA